MNSNRNQRITTKRVYGHTLTDEAEWEWRTARATRRELDEDEHQQQQQQKRARADRARARRAHKEINISSPFRCFYIRFFFGFEFGCNWCNCVNVSLVLCKSGSFVSVVLFFFRCSFRMVFGSCWLWYNLERLFRRILFWLTSYCRCFLKWSMLLFFLVFDDGFFLFRVVKNLNEVEFFAEISDNFQGKASLTRKTIHPNCRDTFYGNLRNRVQKSEWKKAGWTLNLLDRM